MRGLKANIFLRLFLLFTALALVGLLLSPVIGLLVASTPSAILAGFKHPLFLPSLWLSAKTTIVSLVLVVVGGTPLAWWLARSASRWAKSLELLVDLPILLPPAVVGVALLYTFGRSGVVGPLLEYWGLQIPFTTTAVVMAQVIVSAPFFIQSAVAAFRRVDPDLFLVARTLGQDATGAFFRVVIPVAMPGLLGGAALAWGRALGEFGATLLFAGNLPGKTQTMPLAIYMSLESDIRGALALSLCLAGFGVLLLFVLRFLPSLSLRRWEKPLS